MATGLKTSWELIKASAVRFDQDNLWVEAAGLSYYTIFGLPSMLLIILQSTSLIYHEEIIETSLFGIIRDTMGPQSAQQLAQTLEKVGIFDGAWWAITVGIIGLFITPTTSFITIQRTRSSGLWVFYAGAIFFFGAIFTNTYAEEYTEGVQPAEYAVRLKKVAREENRRTEEGCKTLRPKLFLFFGLNY